MLVKDRESSFSCFHPQVVTWPMLALLLLYGGQFGQEYRRKNQGLLTTRSPCATTLHPIKEVKVLLPSV